MGQGSFKLSRGTNVKWIVLWQYDVSDEFTWEICGLPVAWRSTAEKECECLGLRGKSHCRILLIQP